MDQTKLEQHLTTIEIVFARYRPNFPLDSSPVVTDVMHTTLTHDTDAMLPAYLFKALTTWGTIAEFKGLLPRILYKITFEAGEFWSSDQLFHKLAYAKFDQWPEEEQTVINQFLEALWRYILATYPQSDCMILTEFIRDVPHPAKYLVIWERQLNQLAALRYLADFVDVYYGVMQTGYESIGLTPEHHRWIIRHAMQTRLENAYLAHMDQDFAECFSRAAEHL